MKYWTLSSTLISIIITAILHCKSIFSAMSFEEKKELAAVFAQVSATMLGFILAALSIMATISGRRLVKKMNEYGAFEVLLKRFFGNAIAYTLSMMCAFALMLLKPFVESILLFELSFLLFTFSTLLLFDTGYRLKMVLTNLGSD